MNSSHSPNLYNNSGFLRNRRISTLLQGRGKGVNRFTFKALELLLDKEIGSNLAFINEVGV
ncbi:MAG: hypothetical protein AAF518_08955 [Spirochaetota bacterium]